MQLTHSKGNPELIPVIVRLSPQSFAAYADQLPIHSRLKSIHSYSARLTAGQIEQLMDSDQVEYLTVDPRVQATSEAMDADSWNERNPYLAAIGADRMQRMGLDGRGVTVAVFDSGISAHPSLDSSRIRAAVDFTSGVPEMLPAPILGEVRDEYGHGTHVAGIIAASNLGV
ncbi:MAG: S8 family serine peptidase, partial [Acidobacteriota bacterium]